MKNEKFTNVVLLKTETLAAMEEEIPKNPSQFESNRGNSVPPLSDSLLLRTNLSPVLHSQCSERGTQLNGSSTPTSRLPETNIKDPPIKKKKKKGRPRTTRFKPTHEVGWSKVKGTNNKKARGET